jgi:S1-C subfamily serine protease
MIMQKRLILLLFLVLSMFLGMGVFPDPASAQDAETTGEFRRAVISAIQKSVVLIGQARRPAEGDNLVVQHTLGTGFLVDRKYTVATVRSRFSKYVDKGRLVVKFRSFFDPTTFQVLPARILYEFPDKDLAFLRVEGSPSDMSGLSRLELIESVAEIEPLAAETVIVAGHPRLGDFNRDYPILRRGMISSTDLRMNGSPLILLDFLGIPGFSGAPVVVKRTGRVIGMIPGPGSAKGSQGFQWAIPLTAEDYRRAMNASIPSE